jgi:hypothetical protein
VNGKPWAESEFALLRQRKAEGVTLARIAAELGRTIEATKRQSRYINTERSEQPASPEIKAAVAEFAKSAGAIPNPPKPQVLSAWCDEETIGETWKRQEEANARHIEKAKTRSIFSVDFPKDEPIAIAFISDQHIAPGTPVDMGRMRADAEYVRDTPNLFALLGGDGVDNHILIRSAMMAARSQPGDQYALFEYYLGIFAEKILALCSGNHDAWTDQVAGIDMVQWIAQRHKLCYSPSAFSIQVKVGGQPYKIVMRHQYRYNSSFNMTHAVKQLLRMGEDEFDIGCIGHHHEPADENGIYRGLHRWFCRPGSYQISSSYTRQYGWNSTYPTSPTIVLYPGKREMCGFMDMRKAGRFLRSELA